MINIKGIDKAEVLAALYNASRPQGLGFMHATKMDMTIEDARKELDAAGERPYFDYLRGRVMKISLAGDELEERLYDRDNGQGAAYRALAHLVCGDAKVATK